MRYSQIRNMDVSNGEGVGVSLFVQGCNRHCYNCFNSETWDFKGGKEFTDEVKAKFLDLIDKPYVKRISILGGEPLEKENISTVYTIVSDVRLKYPNKSIWLYTGYTIEEILDDPIKSFLLLDIDVLVDGEYIDSERNITLKWRGSKNQRVIDVKPTLSTSKSVKELNIVLHCD